MNPPLVQVGLDRSRAAVEVLGAVHRRLEGRGWPRLGEGGKAVVLQTCHRVEVYCEGLPAPRCVESYLDWLGGDEVQGVPILPLLAVRTGEAAARHLLRVAAGLESAVLGEDQVQGQVREAYRLACARKSAGPLLHRLFHVAFRAGKRVRAETALGGGDRSLAGCGVNMLARVLGGLGGRGVLVLGVGEMGSLAARRLRQRGVGRLVLANRTWQRSRELAQELGAEAVPWDWRCRVLREVEGVVCATGSPLPTVPGEWLAAAAQEGKLQCVVDLAVPANAEVPHPTPPRLTMIDIDTIGRHLAAEEERRRAAVAAAEGIVEEMVQEWLAGLGRGEAWRARQVAVGRDHLAG